MQHIVSQYHQLIFKRPSGTSRGILKTKDSWLLTLSEDDRLSAASEISIIEGLSVETRDTIDLLLATADWPDRDLSDFPAVRFAMEILDLSRAADDPFSLWDTSFSRGNEGIPINGLIWMGDREYMYQQIKQKLAEGFHCLKLKIGAIDFEEEISLIKYVRSQFSADDVELRVDANGAFHPRTALTKLRRLSEYDIHSIEQPIKPKQYEEMSALCETTPISIALDEELIGVRSLKEKEHILNTIRPQYIILKPSLIGGWDAAEEWISLAEDYGIGWWATSALEGNIGLNAISQWISSKDTDMPQGLGTGQLYENNIPSPLYIKDAAIWYDPELSWDINIQK